ncbi:PHB depolymerase family esterase [Sulfitobacter sp. D35]|uniref:extracellular catalytic domain type 1 short-chain-length polyhydroxyalkanoate depolymerase n=1 Tax=Sulfitobacter sp. D35 TaxID=3083252 RepID=UPI00296E7887|nr:PHB depolymerase family esterase [Sulfitobacter sp. D35]MDW4497147.1 PHB depolymerase family esterase [Sulfitobacter sp. D35]
MNDQLASAMCRALELTRAGSTMEATRHIQRTLRGTEQAATMQDDTATRPKSRKSLKEVVDTLSGRAGLRPDNLRRPQVAPAIPDGARYEARTHSSAFGAREFRLFVPSARQTVPSGLLLMLHGCTQNADDFAVGTQMNFEAEAQNLVVVYVDQSRQANQMGCWNWFLPEHQSRQSGEPALLADLALQMAEEFGGLEKRIFAAGLSAGGAMAAILGRTHPDVFSAVGVHSGLAPGAASDLTSAFAAMRGSTRSGAGRNPVPVRSIVFHGEADHTVAPANADAVIAGALGTGRYSEVEDGATVGARVTLYKDQSGVTVAEKWSLAGVAHAWSGGAAEGSYTDPTGPDATAEMTRFFLEGAAEEGK